VQVQFLEQQLLQALKLFAASHFSYCSQQLLHLLAANARLPSPNSCRQQLLHVVPINKTAVVRQQQQQL
jgi:hypothetical protein